MSTTTTAKPARKTAAKKTTAKSTRKSATGRTRPEPFVGTPDVEAHRIHKMPERQPHVGPDTSNAAPKTSAEPIVRTLDTRITDVFRHRSGAFHGPACVHFFGPVAESTRVKPSTADDVKAFFAEHGVREADTGNRVCGCLLVDERALAAA